ncbi:hypothetical protein BBta_4977 [Bradyrhizobium sp. BTAi1]|nr:hypothetical protein BBta_4977 [Bradyrhizobium sp. BTAi1]
MARWAGHVALRQAPRPWEVHLALSVGRRGIDLGGANGLHARGHRLEESPTKLAAAERWLIQENLRLPAF